MNIDDLFYRNTYIPRLTPILCAVCAIVFVALQLGGDKMTPEQSAVWGYLPQSSVWDGRPWALITSVFVHLEIMHFAFNMYWLWVLGNAIEEEIGPLRWLLFFVAAAWVSSAYELLVDGSMGIGMSGVGYALFGFGWVARRKMPSFTPILNPQTVNLFIIWFFLCVVLTYTKIMLIANVAHFAGGLFGVMVAGAFVERWSPLYALDSVPALQPVADFLERFGYQPSPLPGLRAHQNKFPYFLGVALVLFVAGSYTPLVWCPASFSWVMQKAETEDKAGHYEAAVYWYERSIAVGQNAGWAWEQVARLHLTHGNQAGYAQAMHASRQAAAKSEATSDDDEE